MLCFTILEHYQDYSKYNLRTLTDQCVASHDRPDLEIPSSAPALLPSPAPGAPNIPSSGPVATAAVGVEQKKEQQEQQAPKEEKVLHKEINQDQDADADADEDEDEDDEVKLF
jgi:hypothetical protein